MSEKYMFFNSTDDDEREYSAADMADVLSGVCPDGVIEGLTIDKTSYSVIFLSPGKAIINGYFYCLTADKPIEVIRSETNIVLGRLILRLDTVERKITAEVKLSDSSTEFPVLTQNTDIWEFLLADITFKPGYSPTISYNTIFARDYNNLINKPIYSGTEKPYTRLGNDGDIYIQYEE
ncbi:MAG: hypothetical protein IJ192_02515 [Clostridia bacterium]|nr:hypothetical protein [Clostridia bacterium]